MYEVLLAGQAEHDLKRLPTEYLIRLLYLIRCLFLVEFSL